VKRKRTPKVQTTIRLPKKLYEQVKVCVSSGVTTAETLNDFLVAAIQAYTSVLKRRSIDAEFSHMSKDLSYQRESQLIAEEFSQSDWEALVASTGTEGTTHAAR